MSVTRPVVVLDGDPVAEPDRLGDRELDPGDHVAERLARGEADDQPEHRARGEDPGREALDLGELAQRQGERRSRGS